LTLGIYGITIETHAIPKVVRTTGVEARDWKKGIFPVRRN
jgi:hypothetical protein